MGPGPSESTIDTSDGPRRRQLGEYLLLGLIGAGGMGIVYKAQHVRLKKTVAVKVLPPGRHSEKALRRFQQEMEAVGALNHPNIVQATDAGEEDGTYYLVMEFVDGINLADLVAQHGRLSIEVACELICQVSLGLQHVFDNGLVHRDIKPSNLMLSAAGQMKILDLGLARLNEEPRVDDKLTQDGQMMGTLDYMAPEQLEDASRVDIRADIYSLGCTLFHLLTGTSPYSGEQYKSVTQKIVARLSAAVPSVRQKREDCPEELEQVLTRMLAKDPDDRYDRPAVIADRLNPFTGDQGHAECLRLAERMKEQEKTTEGQFQRRASDERETQTAQKSTSKEGSLRSTTRCPYPGLRPFQRDESEFFFGREEHTEQLVEKLRNHRFLAVVGPSGCGKSSMVLAGLMPMLQQGWSIEGAGPHWRAAVTRPGENPFERLAAALLDKQALWERGNTALARRNLETTLHRGAWGLAEALKETGVPKGTNLVLVVDQFEELFHFGSHGSSGKYEAGEAEAFINLLLTPTQDGEERKKHLESLSVYVIITMRWDFLDHQFDFPNLTEAMNRSVFFTPRLTREQCQAAIVGPARILGGDVDAVLANRMLNDTKVDSDQLPLLQHSLMRMWLQSSEPSKLTLTDYDAIGSPYDALSKHANDTFDACNSDQQRIARRMFQWLCRIHEGQRYTRRPVALGDVAKVADATLEQVKEVVDIFCHPNRNFIITHPSNPLNEKTTLDISHECLIRQWDKLKSWVQEEARSAETYLLLRNAADRWNQDEKPRPYADLENAREWIERERPNAAWAQRYGGDFELAIRFLEAGPSTYEFDVFLCYNSQDKPAVRDIARKLKNHGIRPWFDEWDLPPGRTWQDELTRQIDRIRSAAVIIGPHGRAAWQNMELRRIINEFTSRDCSVIPVILPGGNRELEGFLSEFQYVDFGTDSPDPITQLIWGITGERPKI